MVKNLIHDPLILSKPSKNATKDDMQAAYDLLDTLAANIQTCVGMAANMIGINKRIIVFTDGAKRRLMFNPEIISKAAPYETEEGCLSLLGEPRKTTRYKVIKVRYHDEKFAVRTEQFCDFTAQIIQHEIDHCKGILI